MKPRVLLETIVVLRLLLADHPEHYERALGLFQTAEAERITLILTTEILAECVHVLRSFYEQSPEEIASLLQKCLRLPGVAGSEPDVQNKTLELYRKTGLDIADCILAARAQAGGYSVASFDRDFRRFPEVEAFAF